MRIVVSHLTRMHAGYVCVAGVDLETGQHVRPSLAEGALPIDFLARYGGPFDMAALVDLGHVQDRAEPPHVEDRVFAPSRAKCQGSMDPAEFWKLLEGLSRQRLRQIFGAELHGIGRLSCGTDQGRGSASLGCLRLRKRPGLRIERRGERTEIRLSLTDCELTVDARVTDLRLYREDHLTPSPRVVEEVAQRMARARACLLGVGLTRAFASAADVQSRPQHWLQVNNIHLVDGPGWRLD